jgi:hypothetical protein
MLSSQISSETLRLQGHHLKGVDLMSTLDSPVVTARIASQLEKLRDVGTPGINLTPLDLFTDLHSLDEVQTRLKAMDALGINQDHVRAALRTITYSSVCDLLNAEGDMAWTALKKWNLVAVTDNEQSFKYNHEFVVLFMYLLSKLGRLPTCDEYFGAWEELDQPAIAWMLDPKNPAGALGIALGMSFSELPDPLPGLTPVETLVRHGIVVRVRRSWAALIREMFFNTYLCEEYPDTAIFWNPIFDIVGKVDALVVSPRLPSVQALAIYLKSNRSIRNIVERKAAYMPQVFRPIVHSIEMDMKCYRPEEFKNSVYVGDPSENKLLTRAIMGNAKIRQIMRTSYHYGA